MFNAAGKNPVSWTTNGQTIYGTGTLIKVYWFNPANSGDTFTITDLAGNVKLTGRCENSNQSQIFDESNGLAAQQFLNGLVCYQISSGTLEVTIA